MTVLERTVTGGDIVWELDSNEFNVPDGEYRFRATMFDYNNQSADNVFMIWESHLPVSVNEGYMNKTQALDAAAHIIDKCGYWGVFLESIEFDAASNTFDISIGS